MNREELGDQLQAELRIVRNSTIERKQMSTTIKRVALVAVAALGLGVLSVAPSNATSNADSLTLSAATATQAIGDTATATSAVATFSYLASAVTDSMTVTASLVSGPAGNSKLPVLQLVETTSAQVVSAATRGSDNALLSILRLPVENGQTSSVASNNPAFLVPLRAQAASTSLKAKFKVYIDTPVLAGTYVVKLTPAVTGGGGTLNGAAQTLTITVAATVTKPDTTSTAYIVAGAGVDPDGADSATVSAVKTVGTQAGTIVVTQKIASSSTNAKESMTAVITGAGQLGAGSNAAPATGRALTIKYNDKVTIWSDGSSGTGTITITGADSGIVYKTASVTFFDPKPSKVTVTVKKAYPQAGATTSSAVNVVVTDSAGNIIKDASVALRPLTTGTGDTTTSCSYSATSIANVCSVTGVSPTKFGVVNYVAFVTGNDADATEVTSSSFAVTFADIIATSVTITAPATANVGDKVTLTLTAKEKNGYPVADASYEGAAGKGIFWNTTTVPVYSTSSFAPFNSGETITTLSGVATKAVYLPSVSGTVTGTWTLAGTAGTNVSTGSIDKTISGGTVAVSIAVGNPGVDAATDAANEATDAANAATDAALAAADAADAATMAAQDASDAVAALSASVSKLIASLKAQITSLTNLVIKIQKKVKA